MLFIADARVDGDGKFRFQLSREDVPVTSRLRFSIMANTDKEYMAGFRYIITKYFGVSTHYDSDMGLGAGITLNYWSLLFSPYLYPRNKFPFSDFV